MYMFITNATLNALLSNVDDISNIIGEQNVAGININRYFSCNNGNGWSGSVFINKNISSDDMKHIRDKCVRYGCIIGYN